MRAFHRLRPLCERRLGGIPVPVPFSLTAFANCVARRRERSIRVLSLPGLDGSDALSGAWVATDAVDYILVDADASPWHRDLIGLHEMAHLLCDHRADGRLPAEVSVLLPRQGGNAVPVQLRPDHAYTRAEEREADLMASLILERSVSDPLPVCSTGREGVAGRLAQVLRHPVRHA